MSSITLARTGFVMLAFLASASVLAQSPGLDNQIVSRSVVGQKTANVGAETRSRSVLKLTRNTIDAGGNFLSGANIRMTATAGQPEAGILSGGTLTLNAGFYAPEGLTGPVADRIFSDRFEHDLQP